VDEKQSSSDQKPEQLDLRFGSRVPSREDAKREVSERKKSGVAANRSRTKTVAKPKKPATPVSSGKKKSQDVSSTGQKKRITRQSKQQSRKTPQKKKAQHPKKARKKGKKRPISVHIPLPIFIGVIVLIAILIGSLIAWQIAGYRPLDLLGSMGEPIMVTIDPGMSARAVAGRLADFGVISDAKAFERYLEVRGLATKIQAGPYVFEPDLTLSLVAEQLVAADVQKTSSQEVTIFAGSTIDGIDEQLVSLQFAEKGAFRRAVEQLQQERGLPFAEGWFLSGNYQFDTVEALATDMQDALNDAIRPYLSELETLRIPLSHVIIIASMIQRETDDVLQMADISGVIYNRIRSDLPLGIDATLRYALDAWNRSLTSAELNGDNPYNTRRVKGMPPTGIGCPSSAAIDAAMRPAEHHWYYYLHDNSGDIHFAQTYEEHLQNRDQYLR
jgi:UPF0755 protein